MLATAPPETTEAPAEPWRLHCDVRELMLGSLDLVLKVGQQLVGLQKLRDLAVLLCYGDACGRMGRSKRTRMDVDELVTKWTAVLVELSTSHDGQVRDQAEARTDELLGPLLLAPIGQVREFAQKLAAALEADPRVPFMVWSGFRRVVAPLVLRGPDGATIALRTELAQEIAELVEAGLARNELITAIAAALQWRSPAALEQVRTELRAGTAPRLRGRESCLFLSVGEAFVQL